MRLDGFEEEILEITTTRNLRAEGVVVHRVPHLRFHDKAFTGPLVTTTAARTLLDLGAVADFEAVEDGLECALRRKLTTIAALNWELDRTRNRGLSGTRVLEKLLSVRPRNYNPKKSSVGNQDRPEAAGHSATCLRARARSENAGGIPLARLRLS